MGGLNTHGRSLADTTAGITAINLISRLKNKR